MRATKMPPQSHHIVKQFDIDLGVVKEKLLLMASLVESQIVFAMHALENRDVGVAQRVEQSDRPVNLLELEIDELCVRIMALRQPAASDLRFIAAAFKIVTDLERVGDIAVNIAERAEALARSPQRSPAIDLMHIALEAQSMLKDSLDAFVHGDAAKAERVLGRDQPVDAMFVAIFHTLIESMKNDPQTVDRCVGLIFIAKHLERIADHSTNIAEMVVYLVRGQDVRHKFSVNERSR